MLSNGSRRRQRGKREPRLRIQGRSEALVAYSRRYVGVLFRGQWCFIVGEGKRAEYNGLIGEGEGKPDEYNGLIEEGEGKRGKDNGAESGTKERDVALFRQARNMGKPRFRVQGRGEALVARCRRYSAMLSELRYTIVTRNSCSFRTTLKMIT